MLIHTGYVRGKTRICKACGEVEQNTIARAEMLTDVSLSINHGWMLSPVNFSKYYSEKPWHCAYSIECLNAIRIDQNNIYGAWLGNRLSNSGIDYVRECMTRCEDNPLYRLWAYWYKVEK